MRGGEKQQDFSPIVSDNKANLLALLEGLVLYVEFIFFLLGWVKPVRAGGLRGDWH